MASSRKLEMTALFGLLLQAVFAGVTYILYAVSRSHAVYAQFWYLSAGLLVWLAVLVHGRQRRLAREEEEERQRLKQTRVSDEIFEEMELDRMRAASGLRVFEKYLVPVVSIVLSGYLLVVAYWLVAANMKYGLSASVNEPAAVGVSILFIFFLGLLMGRYAAGLAQLPGYRLLRAAAGYMLGNVAAGGLLMVAITAAYFGKPWPAKLVAYVIPIGMGIVGVEIILNFVLGAYRPRVSGEEARPPYDSRILGLFAEPGGVLKTIADTLDYQFGFKVSETWFYRFMERAIVPLIIVQVLTLWLLSCIFVVDPHEVAFVERCAVPVVRQKDADRGLKATVFEPGFYLKLPWPFEKVQYLSAYELRGMVLGREYTREGWRMLRVDPHGDDLDPQTLLWKGSHIASKYGRELPTLVPGAVTEEVGQDRQVQDSALPTAEDEAPAQDRSPEVNIVDVLGHVQFRVKTDGNGRIEPSAAYDYRYRHADPDRLVEQIADAVLCRIAAGQDYLRWLNVDREAVDRRLRADLQAALDAHSLGVEIVYAGIPMVHPPHEVAAAYENVINAFEEKEMMVNQGKREGVELVGASRVKAIEMVADAQAYSYRLSTMAKAEAERFRKQRLAYEKAPQVYKYRKYFSAVEQILRGHRIFVVPDANDEVQIIDLQERLGSGLLDLQLEEPGQ